MKWLYADVIIGIHTIIILMERKIFDNKTSFTERSLRSGRTVINTIIYSSGIDTGTVRREAMQLQ